MPPARAARTAAARTASRPAASRPAASRPAPARRRPASARPRSVALRAPHLRVRWERVGRIGLLVVFAVVVGLYAQHALSYLSTHAQAARQHAIVTSLTRQNAALRARARSLGDPATIVLAARRLGMVRPGEQPYAIIGQSGN